MSSRIQCVFVSFPFSAVCNYSVVLAIRSLVYLLFMVDSLFVTPLFLVSDKFYDSHICFISNMFEPDNKAAFAIF